MNCPTIQTTETQANYSKFYRESFLKTNLVAQWFMVDGKLICKWFRN